jgi:hypothetical protein
MEINFLPKLIICQGLGAAAVCNWRNWKCAFCREVIYTQAVEKFLVFAKIAKCRCPASNEALRFVGSLGCSVGVGRQGTEGRYGVVLVTGQQKMQVGLRV